MERLSRPSRLAALGGGLFVLRNTIKATHLLPVRAAFVRDLTRGLLMAAALVARKSTQESGLPSFAKSASEEAFEAGASGCASLIGTADQHAKGMLPILRTLRSEGAITIGAITRSLNERKIPTPRGSRWHVSSVANLLARAQKLDPGFCCAHPGGLLSVALRWRRSWSRTSQ